MKTLVFLVVLLFPNGSTQTISETVESCPNQAAVSAYWDQQKQAQNIVAWNAACFQVFLPTTKS